MEYKEGGIHSHNGPVEEEENEQQPGEDWVEHTCWNSSHCPG